MRSKLFFCIFIGLLIFTSLTELTFGEKVVNRNHITLFMAGDVMTGRGIDQVLPHPSDPQIYEPYLKNARGYVKLAEETNGPIQKPVKCSYIWGDALQALERAEPDLRIINLETSITTSNDYWVNKGINYRMHPENIACISEASIDYCSLANNHILDWGYSGLTETLETLDNANIKRAGAGLNLQEAEAPAILTVKGKGKVIVFSFGLRSSGIPSSWAASKNRPGVTLLKNLSMRTVRHIKEMIEGVKQQGDIVIASIHWGSNWGYAIPDDHTEFAHKLIDIAGVDIIHGHSSHHFRALEVYKGKLIIYGSGDFLNDYEGIGGHEEYKSDLSLMYFARIDPYTGKLVHLQMTPMQIKHFKLNRISRTEALWLQDTLNREGMKFGTRVQLNEDNTLTLKQD
jgi:poly-gamma-glutamate synthesis protein (capsule biosynthesis protein)